MAEASSWERQRRQEGVADREISGLGHHQKGIARYEDNQG